MEGEGYVIKYLYFSFISLENCIPKSIRDLEPKKWYRIKNTPSYLHRQERESLNLLINKKNVFNRRFKETLRSSQTRKF